MIGVNLRWIYLISHALSLIIFCPCIPADLCNILEQWFPTGAVGGLRGSQGSLHKYKEGNMYTSLFFLFSCENTGYRHHLRCLKNFQMTQTKMQKFDQPVHNSCPCHNLWLVFISSFILRAHKPKESTVINDSKVRFRQGKSQWFTNCTSCRTMLHIIFHLLSPNIVLNGCFQSVHHFRTSDFDQH